jgi:hypothetical protein
MFEKGLPQASIHGTLILVSTNHCFKEPTMTQPLYYLRALSMTDDNFSTVTSATLKAAYAEAAKTGHPDHDGDPVLWALITSAYNEMKSILAKKRGATESKTDEAWLRSFTEATKPKAKSNGTGDGWVFEEVDGESKDDRRKRYARSRQQFRYATDPEYAAARKEASLRSHKKSAERAKAEKAAKAAPAAA